MVEWQESCGPWQGCRECEMFTGGHVGAADRTQHGGDVYNAARRVVDNHTTSFITLTALEMFSSLVCLCVFLAMKGKVIL